MERIALSATDGVPLNARWYPAQSPTAALFIAPAVGVPQQFYARFATWLSERGVSVFTLDYRGIADSAPSDLRGFFADLRCWGERDLPAAIEAFVERSPELPRVWLGHSFGGQALALAPVQGRFQGAITIASGFVHRRDWPGPRRYVFHALLGAVGPWIGRFHGYVPGWTGVGTDLPAGVMEEWGRWCLSERYLLDHVPGAEAVMRALAFPVRCYGVTDDTYTPPPGARRMADLYGQGSYHELAPADVGLDRLGHFGVFRPNAEGAWQRLLGDVRAFAR